MTTNTKDKKKRFTSIGRVKYLDELDKLSEETRLNKADLWEEALLDLLKKYEAKRELYKR